MSTKERLAYLDYARVFCVFLVIYGHLLTFDVFVPRAFIYSFHMALFFFISGVLHKYNGTIQWKKYAKTIIIPFLFFNCLLFLISPLFNHWGIWHWQDRLGDISLAERYKISFISGIKGFISSRNIPNEPTWFLIALFYCKVFLDVFKLKKIISSIVFIFLSCIIAIKSLNYFFILNGLMAIPFYISGHYAKSHINRFIKNKKSIIAIVTCVCLIATISLTLIQGKVSMLAVSFGGQVPFPFNILLFYLNGFIGTFMLVSFSGLFRSRKIITDIASSLISILGLQFIFNYTLYCLGIVNEPFYITSILSVIILLLCYFIHKIIMRYIPFVLGKF